MIAFMEILILWIIMYKAGHCDPRKIIVPTIIEDHHERIYQCNFNETVDCLWQKSGITTNISPYKYVEGNGIHTQDCSIVADISQPKLKVEECIGLIRPPVIPKAIPGGSTQLECSQTKIHCSWKRNGSVVNIDNIKYKYTGEHNGNDATDCSITIANTTATDIGRWQCLKKTTSDTNSDAPIIATYDLQWTPTSTAEPEAKTTPPNTDEQKSSSKADNSNKANEQKETRMVAYLTSACAVIVNVIIITIIVVYRRLKSKRKKIKNQEMILTVKEDVGGLNSPRELPRTPNQPPNHTYYNAEAIASSRNSTDADGYLVAKKADTRNTSDSKTVDYENVQKHVYEKIL